MLGDIFNLRGFYIWHLIMAIIMCSVWVILFSLTLVAFFKGKIFYAKDEDVLKDLVTAKLIDDDKEVYAGMPYLIYSERVQMLMLFLRDFEWAFKLGKEW